MGCVSVCSCCFLLAIGFIVVGLALPKWYEKRYEDFNKDAFTKGNLWRICYFHPDTPYIGPYPMDSSPPGVNETCDYTHKVFRGNDYFVKLQTIQGLVGAGLALSFFAAIMYLIFMCEKKQEMRRSYTFSKVGMGAAILGLLAGILTLAGVTLFSLTIREITDEKVPQAVAPWLTVTGAALQCLIGLCTLLYLCVMKAEAKHPTTDVDVMMDSAVHTIQVVENRGFHSNA